jgi:hypothetical protein
MKRASLSLLFCCAMAPFWGAAPMAARDLDPARLGRSAPLGGEIQAVAVEGRYAYCAVSGLGLAVIDAGDPGSPVLVAEHEIDGAAEVSVSEGHAYVRGSGALHLIDVAAPTRPAPAGRYALDDWPRSLVVSGRWAYTAYVRWRADLDEWEGGFEVIDARDSARPRRAGGYVRAASDGVLSRLFVSGRHAFFGRDVVDIGDPAEPRLVRSNASAPSLVHQGHAWYEDPTGVEVVDVSDPSSPRPLGRYVGPAPSFASGAYAYGLGVVIDVSLPATPRVVGGIAGFDLKFAVNDRAYGVRPGERRILEVVEVGRPANPQRAGSLEGISGRDIALFSVYAYVTEGALGLQVLDVSDPQNPRRAGGLDSAGQSERVFIDTSPVCAYVADGFAGLQVLDLTDLARPVRKGGIEMTGIGGAHGYAYDVFVADGLAYVASWTSGSTGSLEVIDVREPAAPRRIGRLETLGSAGRVLVSGSHAYVYTGDLRVIDVSDPAAPRQVAVASGAPVHVSGSLLYVSHDDALQVLDVSHPSRPVLLGEQRVLGLARTAISDSAAFVLGSSGLEVFDLSQPAAPRRIGGNSAVWLPGNRLAVTGNKVFVLQPGRLLVLDIPRPFPPASLAALAGEGSVELAWSPPPAGPPETGYDVYRLSPGPRAKVNTEPVGATSFTVSGLENGLEHCFAVQALSDDVAGDGIEASDDSAPACATPRAGAARFLRGDCDGDGRVAGLVTDAVYLLGYNFRGGPRPACLAACDANGDGRVDGVVTDAVYLLNHNFLGGPAPVAPFPGCGAGALETDGSLGCDTSPSCP